jgi:hypothetical protein
MPFVASPWTRHSKGLNYQGQSVCLRCGIELPYMMPIQQTICTKEDRLYIGDVDGAVDCHAI